MLWINGLIYAAFFFLLVASNLTGGRHRAVLTCAACAFGLAFVVSINFV